MKKIQYVKLVGLLTILLFLNISCKDDDTLLRGSGITEQSWSTNQTYFASAEQTLTFTFTTLSSWTAQNSSTALLSLDNTAGNSGENTIKVTVHKSSQEQGTITIKVNGYSSASNIKIQLSDDDVQGYEINYSVDQYLREKYLWNDDYKLGIYTLFTLIFKKLTFMIINFKLFVIFAPNIRIRLDFSNRSNDI